jgi:hypothetical protein
MLDTRLPDYDTVRVLSQQEQVWNALIPKSAVEFKIVPDVGVKYLHATKGWKWVGKKRFAIRGVL